MRFYSVHERAVAPGADPDVVFVREGFSFLALLMPMIWALWHRLWLALGVYVLIGLCAGLAAEALALSEIADGLIGLGINLLAALTANDWRRASLRRSGYREMAIVGAANLVEAERRYFENRPGASQPRSGLQESRASAAAATAATSFASPAGATSFPGFAP